MNLKDKMAATKKEDSKKEITQKEEAIKNGKYNSHEKILDIFKKAFQNKEEDSIVVRYRLRLKEPRGDERVRISMGGAHRDIAEVIGDCVLIKERKAYHIFMQDADIKKMFNELAKKKRLNGAG